MHCAVLILLRTDPAKVRLATTGRTPKEVPSLDEDWENYTQLLLSIQPQLGTGIREWLRQRSFL